MPRLLTFPVDLRLASITPITGPKARGSGQNTAMDGSEQTFDAIGDLVSFRVEFGPMQGAMARRIRGLQLALSQNANAYRFQLPKTERLSQKEAGVTQAFNLHDMVVTTWTNDAPWSNSLGWSNGWPMVDVASSANAGTSIVRLTSQFWGNSLGIGDQFGFMPYHFGIYTVTEVISAGVYRVWPDLRVRLSGSEKARLDPVMAVKLINMTASYSRNGESTEGVSMDVVEVIDPYIRANYT